MAIDIETTGLEPDTDKIIAIGMVKINHGVADNPKQILIKIDEPLSDEIIKLTGYTNKWLETEGVDIVSALSRFVDTVENLPIIGFNVNFDINFINKNLIENGMLKVENEITDLRTVVKKNELFLNNYRLETVLAKYGIENINPHHAESDALATAKLADQLIKK
ncbi:3'-5' exonuclease [Amylolactobacillus amylophilus]|uniref:3'-5' exonuclease n=1 Tax=Amylolactobacillus amylophilus TaxID=1603 RepID=UPI000A53607F|nr:3'-5' exonuclease [Amylolactobacillus amylophilus]